MSRREMSGDTRENDPYAEVERAAEMIWEKAQQALSADEASRISDEAVALLLTAAVKLYARKTDGEQRTFRPLKGHYDEVVTPTEALTAVTELLRCLHLGPVEFGLWSRRLPPGHYMTEYDIDQDADAAPTEAAR